MNRTRRRPGSTKASETAAERRMISPREAAKCINRSYDWFIRHRRKLEAENGFPPPVPGVGRYDRHAIDAWITSATLCAQFILKNPMRVDELRHRPDLALEEELGRRAELLARGLLKK